MGFIQVVNKKHVQDFTEGVWKCAYIKLGYSIK